MAASSLSVCCLKADPDHTIVDAMFYTKVIHLHPSLLKGTVSKQF